MTIGELYQVSNPNAYFRVYNSADGDLIIGRYKKDLSGEVNFNWKVEDLWADEDGSICISTTIEN